MLECVKCGVHYTLTEHCTPTKCPICTSGMTLDLPRIGVVDYKKIA